MEIRVINYNEALNLIARCHYSKVMPRLTKICLGAFHGNELVGVTTWGYGVRPMHTIRKIFPSLGVKDYFELGKFCVKDSYPKNTESQILALAIDWMRNNRPQISVLFTWADGMIGKPGYVYQASNFLYGGFIWTDSYFKNGEKIHPRSTAKIGGRPNRKKMGELGMEQYFGKQFMYVKFLCSHAKRKFLLNESPFEWTTNYPKHTDLEWKKSAEVGREACEQPIFNGSIRFRSPAPLFDKDIAV